MFYNHTNTPSFYSVLTAALVFTLALAGVAVAQSNTTLGTGAFQSNTTGRFNTAIGGVRSFPTPQANATPPADMMRSVTTPRAPTTPPADWVRSLATPRAAPTPRLGPLPMCLLGI
jgi:hypothetical protein